MSVTDCLALSKSAEIQRTKRLVCSVSLQIQKAIKSLVLAVLANPLKATLTYCDISLRYALRLFESISLCALQSGDVKYLKKKKRDHRLNFKSTASLLSVESN